MAPHFFTGHRDTHIINLAKIARSSSKSCDLEFYIASRGKKFLIVSTKYQVEDLVASIATEA